jgi:amino acid transporter
MAPSMAANINPQGTASTVGRAVPLAFALATIGVLLIAWTFVRLTQRFNHAGSVYGFVGATLGEEAQEPRRDIPRAILGVAIFGGLYFIFVTAIEVMGFGTDARGIDDFIASGSLLGDLGSQFVAGWVGERLMAEEGLTGTEDYR